METVSDNNKAAFFFSIKAATSFFYFFNTFYYMKAARFENLTKGPMEGAHARVRPGRMRRPRKLK